MNAVAAVSARAGGDRFSKDLVDSNNRECL